MEASDTLESAPSLSPPESGPPFLTRLILWCGEGMCTAFFVKPKWQGLQTDATIIAVLIAIEILFSVAIQRLYIEGPANFYWKAIAGGWAGTVIAIWACYLVRNQAEEASSESTAPDAAHLFTLVLAQSMFINIGMGLLYVVLVRAHVYSEEVMGIRGLWALWLAPGVWAALAQLVLLWRAGNRQRLKMGLAILAILLSLALSYSVKTAEFWYAKESDSKGSAQKQLRLTQQLMEAQPQLLATHLNGLKPQRKGVVDLYAITFAPYEQDVFRRESAMVAQVMAKRFDAEGKVLQLVNHVDTAGERPWATPLNLQRAIRHVAQVMNRDEDILFIHMTSHGARDGELAANFWPLEVEELHPPELKTRLDEAGIRYRVISVSACYSGSWITPLANDATLVMTAADAEHTSYGCGSKSELTFFGRAMYDEQLRNATLSFEEAHRAARVVIEQREKEAGKDDGYSNPQISVGEQIRKQLAALLVRLNASQPSR